MDILEQKLMLYGADTVRALERFGGNLQVYRECIALFVSGDSFARLKGALLSGNTADAFDISHAMKGAAGNLGLTPMLDAISEIVEPLRGGAAPDLSAETDELERQRKQLEEMVK
jgi:HPt (histidine-containing phosphotransfer) domain-containing protein